ncbi:hypothetical protein MTR67_018784 [Solanum verrucosum]|uniref:Uncharacterized protein n=1 Tax=Solanum verrucosum TaxID=315347 RepID=A0AAF0QSZ5_SOLVR|nr:hypothetical protein MTR67_018784 [Solanum verrucosum]
MKDSLTYKEVPIEILNRQVQRLRNKEVASVKVLWNSQSIGGATWKAEAAMKAKSAVRAPNSYPLKPNDALQGQTIGQSMIRGSRVVDGIDIF